MAKVILVGAGPGDIDLITVKGLKAIQNADCILYDALSNESLLDFSKEDAVKIYVGKRRGCKTNKQEAINELIVNCALKYKNVVRLKGGDSFVFGRGYEELAFAKQHGVEVEVIPGISSSISVPASIGIPVTTRGVNESFWVTTGTLSDGSLSEDIAHAAKSSATVVVLMGMAKLEQIMDIFKGENKENTPVAIIQNGTTANQREIIATVKDISSLAREQNFDNPSIIIIGEVVRLCTKTELFEKMNQYI
ncbi:MAG: uroporphyrinogen-III C-methyltransferase [Cytophagales bacterium]